MPDLPEADPGIEVGATTHRMPDLPEEAVEAALDTTYASRGPSTPSSRRPTVGETGWTEWVRVNGKVHHGIDRWPEGVSTEDWEPTPEELAAEEADRG